MIIHNVGLDRYEKAALANTNAPEGVIFVPDDFTDDPSMWAVILEGVPERQAGLLGVMAFDHLNPEYGLKHRLGVMGMRGVIGNDRFNQSSYRTDHTLDMQCLSAIRWTAEQSGLAAVEIFAEETMSRGVDGALATIQKQNIGPTLTLIESLVEVMEARGIFPELIPE